MLRSAARALLGRTLQGILSKYLSDIDVDEVELPSLVGLLGRREWGLHLSNVRLREGAVLVTLPLSSSNDGRKDKTRSGKDVDVSGSKNSSFSSPQKNSGGVFSPEKSTKSPQSQPAANKPTSKAIVRLGKRGRIGTLHARLDGDEIHVCIEDANISIEILMPKHTPSPHTNGFHSNSNGEKNYYNENPNNNANKTSQPHGTTNTIKEQNSIDNNQNNKPSSNGTTTSTSNDDAEMNTLMNQIGRMIAICPNLTVKNCRVRVHLVSYPAHSKHFTNVTGDKNSQESPSTDQQKSSMNKEAAANVREDEDDDEEVQNSTSVELGIGILSVTTEEEDTWEILDAGDVAAAAAASVAAEEAAKVQQKSTNSRSTSAAATTPRSPVKSLGVATTSSFSAPFNKASAISASDANGYGSSSTNNRIITSFPNDGAKSPESAGMSLSRASSMQSMFTGTGSDYESSFATDQFSVGNNSDNEEDDDDDAWVGRTKPFIRRKLRLGEEKKTSSVEGDKGMHQTHQTGGDEGLWIRILPRQVPLHHPRAARRMTSWRNARDMESNTGGRTWARSVWESVSGVCLLRVQGVEATARVYTGEDRLYRLLVENAFTRSTSLGHGGKEEQRLERFHEDFEAIALDSAFLGADTIAPSSSLGFVDGSGTTAEKGIFINNAKPHLRGEGGVKNTSSLATTVSEKILEINRVPSFTNSEVCAVQLESNFHRFARGMQRVALESNSDPLHDDSSNWRCPSAMHVTSHGRTVTKATPSPDEDPTKRHAMDSFMPVAGLVFHVSFHEPLELNIDRTSLEVVGEFHNFVSCVTKQKNATTDKGLSEESREATTQKQQKQNSNVSVTNPNSLTFPDYMQPHVVHVIGVELATVTIRLHTLRSGAYDEMGYSFCFFDLTVRGAKLDMQCLAAERHSFIDVKAAIASVDFRHFKGVCRKTLLSLGGGKIPATGTGTTTPRDGSKRHKEHAFCSQTTSLQCTSALLLNIHDGEAGQNTRGRDLKESSSAGTEAVKLRLVLSSLHQPSVYLPRLGRHEKVAGIEILLSSLVANLSSNMIDELSTTLKEMTSKIMNVKPDSATGQPEKPAKKKPSAQETSNPVLWRYQLIATELMVDWNSWLRFKTNFDSSIRGEVSSRMGHQLETLISQLRLDLGKRMGTVTVTTKRNMSSKKRLAAVPSEVRLRILMFLNDDDLCPLEEALGLKQSTNKLTRYVNVNERISMMVSLTS